MRKIAKITESDRKALFHNTAAKMGMTDAIIEKDFWVCYMLDYLFHHCAWKDRFAFKGDKLVPPLKTDLPLRVVRVCPKHMG